MVALSTAERDLLRYLLNSGEPVASADLACRMNLTVRQIRYRLGAAEAVEALVQLVGDNFAE